MKYALGIACLMTLAWVQSAPQAGPPPLPESSLAPWCRTPKCPTYLTVNLPYPLDCLQYTECTQGERKIKPCPPDQQFNEAKGNCTDRKSANCVPCWQKVQ